MTLIMMIPFLLCCGGVLNDMNGMHVNIAEYRLLGFHLPRAGIVEMNHPGIMDDVVRGNRSGGLALKMSYANHAIFL